MHRMHKQNTNFTDGINRVRRIGHFCVLRNPGFVLCLVSVLSVFCAFAGFRARAWAQPAGMDPERIFARGNALYQDGKFDEAIREYDRILAAGLESGPLYYNIANSYFKMGEVGAAVLNYERARSLIPGDSDVRSNYSFAREEAGLDFPVMPGTRIAQWNDRFWSGLGTDALTAVASSWYTLIFLLLAAGLIIRRPGVRRTLHVLLGVCVVAALVSFAALKRRVRYLERGVVVTESTDAKFAPLESATTYFPLPQGSLAEVLEINGKYLKVRRADGKTGWVPKGTVTLIANSKIKAQNSAL